MTKRHGNGLRQRVTQFIATRSLRTRLISVMWFSSLIAMILIAIGVVAFVGQIETAAWRGRQGEAAQTAATIISQVLEDAGHSLRFAGLVERAHLIQQPRLLHEMLRQEPALLELVRLDAEGNLSASAFRDESLLAHVFTLSQSVWFQQARAGKFFTSNVQISPQNQPYLILAMPAPDGGVVAARLTMDVLWSVTRETRFGRAGRIYVVNHAGDIIAHTDPQIVLRRENIGARPEHDAMVRAPRNEWQGEYINRRDEAVVGASAAVHATDWIVIAELPQDEAFAMTRLAGGLVFAGALIAFTLSNWFARIILSQIILQPLAHLRRGAEQIGQGNWSHRIPVHARDEIGQVADAFNVMTDRLQERDAQIATRAQSLRTLEKALATMNLGVTITDVQGNILYVNPADARMHGYTVAELLGKSSRIYTPDAPVIARTPDVVKAWRTWQRESVNVRKDGSLFPVQIISDVVLDTDGEPFAVVASCLDITERKNAERALRRVNEELEAHVRARTLELAAANRQLSGELIERQRAQELQTILYETLRALSAQPDAPAVARIAAETIARLTNYPHVCIALPTPDGASWVVRGAAGALAASIGATYAIAQGIIGKSFRAAQTQWVRDILDDPGYVRDVNVADAPALRSEIVVPLCYDKRMLGALNIESERVDAFDARDVAMMQSLGDLIALALENARLYDDLRASEERWRSLVAHAPAVIATFDRDGTVRSINRVRSQRSIADVVGAQIYDFLPPAEQIKMREVLELIFHFGNPVQYESCIQRRDGSLVWYENFAAPIRENNQVVSAIYVSLDISERKHAQEALRASEEKYRQLFEVESDAIFLIDNVSGEILQANTSAALLYGYTRDELLAMRNTDLSAEPQKTRRAMQEKMNLIPTRYHRKKDGTVFPVEIVATHLTWQDRAVHIAAIRDITERKHAEDALTQRARELALLYETSLLVSAQTDLLPLLHTITKRAAELLNTRLSGLFLVNPDGVTIRLVVAHNFPASMPIGTTFQFGEGLSGRVAQTGAPMAINDYLVWEGRLTHHPDWTADRVLAVPLRAHQRVIGVITLADDTRTGAFGDDEIRLVQLFSDQAAGAIENAQLYDQVQKLAITDELTGLFNRRGLFQLGEREVARAARFDHPLAIVMFDIDHFKQVNDRYGHLVGDGVLGALARRAEESARQIDLLARYGGEEFVLLLPETNGDAALQVAERLRQSVAEMRVANGDHSIQITISIGVAEANVETSDLAALIAHVDDALLRAKDRGRNRVERA